MTCGFWRTRIMIFLAGNPKLKPSHVPRLQILSGGTPIQLITFSVEKKTLKLFKWFTRFSMGFLRGGGGDSAIFFPKVPQSSRPESLGFPSYPLPLNLPPLKNPTTCGCPP